LVPGEWLVAPCEISSNPILPNEERDYWLLRSDRTCASSTIGSAAPCPRQVYAFTWLPPSFAVGTPETRSLFKQKMPR